MSAPRYLRVSIGCWSIDLYSAEAERIFHQIETDGVAVFAGARRWLCARRPGP